MSKTRYNHLALTSAAFLVILVLAWLGATLFLSFIVRKDCQKLASAVQQSEGMVTIHDYHFQRRWLDSKLKFKLVLNPPVGPALKLGCEGIAVHGPLVIDWLSLRAAAAIVDLEVYALDSRTEQPLGFLGKVRLRVSFNGKIRTINWPRQKELKLTSGSKLAWQQLDLKLCYLPRSDASLPNFNLALEQVELTSEQHNFQFQGLNLTYDGVLGRKIAVNQLQCSNLVLDDIWKAAGVKLYHASKDPVDRWEIAIQELSWRDMDFQEVTALVERPFSGIELDTGAEMVEPDFAINLKELSFKTSSGETKAQATFNGSSDALNFWSPFSTYHFQGEFSMPKALVAKFIKHFPKLRAKIYMQPIIRELNTPSGDKVRFNWIKTQETQMYRAVSAQ